jgi:putative CocE/NonD family hydrolase
MQGQFGAWAFVLLSFAWTSAGSERSNPRYAVRMEYDQRVPMRDGVTLSADVFRPDEPGKFPVVLVRTVYDNASAGYATQGMFWASRGYAYVVQDVRGRGESEGTFYPLVHEARDGEDTLAWCARQAWSSGKVGTTGSSYLGWTQVYAAASPHLSAMIPIVTPPDPHRNFPVQFGAYAPTTISWLAYISGRTLQDTSHIDLMKAYWHLPLIEMDSLFGRRIPAWRDWLDHPTLDAYWGKQAYQEKLLGTEAPALHISGWYDDVLVGTTENFINLTMRGSSPLIRARQWLLIGPWGHRINTRSVGGVDFGPGAVIDLEELQLQWFGHWLEGKDNGVDAWPKVRIFVMGENRWRDEKEWPLARTEYKKLFLRSRGRANSRFGDGTLGTEPPGNEPPDRYRYDPRDPVPFLTEPNFSQIGGPDDYRAVERRDDVLVYDGPVLEESLEVCGPLRVKLYAASSARDTDWTAKLLDVRPDGYAQRLNDGIVRARFRRSLAREEFLTPGAVEEYDVDCWSTCIVMGKGHRLRLEISSSAFPKFDRNLNTGGPIGKESEGLVAEQSVYHDAARPSHVLVPVVPRR